MDFSLIRSRRKTVAIIIRRDGCVEVRAPFYISKRELERFVSSKNEWIEKHLKEVQKRVTERQCFCIQAGDTLLLLGKEYPVKEGEKLFFDGIQFWIPQGNFACLLPQLITWYCNFAENYIKERVDFYAQRMKVVPIAVKIGKANSYWGCCSAKNSINFSWKLIMAEPDVVDYVVVHELCHIVEPVSYTHLDVYKRQ